MEPKKDHYVPQVYLRRFYSPELSNKLYVFDKKRNKLFETGSKNICAIKKGSTNNYLKDKRAIEIFLKCIETNLDQVIKNFEQKNVNDSDIYTISGLVASIESCSPAGMRIRTEPTKNILEAGQSLDKYKGDMDDVLRNQPVELEVDPKFSQSLGISNIEKLAQGYINRKWEVLFNKTDSAFFTSDFPIAVEKTRDPMLVNRIVPLSPNLAIRFHHGKLHTRNQNSIIFRNLKDVEVRKINKLIVQSAERQIFFRDNHPWVEKFVKKNSNYFVRAVTTTISDHSRFLIVSVLKIVERG